MRTIALVFAALLLPTTVHAEGNVPPSMLRIDGPATVYAPAVRVDPPGPQPTVERSVEQIIRDVWPDNLEARALRIAYRESRYQPNVRTWCCYGVFQIHQIHLRWLCPELGICTRADLYDPVLNVEAAYALYLRDGWAPWSL